mmetsp:Transcript_67016/g.216040  ORF Transcript_67016/g.216040 Transcript_67016/m.216040 type:complete len:252 (+) Transcript_67016:933-1688(+)
MRALATSARAKRTDCFVTRSPSSFSSSSSSSSSMATDLRRRFGGSAGSSLAHCKRLMICTTTPAMFFTPSFVRTPAPALRMTPATPTALAWSGPSADSSISPCEEPAMAPTMVSRNLATSSWRTLLSRRPASTERRAQSARSSQVLKARSRRSSESCSSSRGRRLWQAVGMNSQKSSSRASIRVFTRSRDSFISSRMLVFRPMTLPSIMVRLMSGCSSSSSSPSSSGMSARSISTGRCFRTSKITGSKAGT